MNIYLLAAAVSLGSIWGKVWPILVAILYFGFLILSHEIGHFSAARAFRVKVTEFSMGMGPRLLKRRSKKTGILYSLKAIPFGGSVLMEEDEVSEDPRAFTNQKPWKRFCILFAGAFVNLVCGVLIMGVVVGFSADVFTMQVRGFRPEAATQAQGLQAGDTLYKINGKRVYTWVDLNFLVSRGGEEVDLTVKRDGKKVQLPAFAFPQLELEDGTTDWDLDFGLVFYTTDPQYAEISAGRPTPGLRVTETLRQSATMSRMVYLSLWDMVTGKFRLNDISGPIGVVTILSTGAQEVQEASQENNRQKLMDTLLWLLTLFGMISINIGIMNLLPIPALDGGRLLFCLVEMIFRKPIPKKLEGYVHAAGFALLMLFMVVISFSDIWALVTGKR